MFGPFETFTALGMERPSRPPDPTAPKPIRVFVADDHGIVRDVVKLLLSRTAGLELAGEASDGRALVESVLAASPDVIVVDISMPELNGLDAIRKIKARGFAGAVVLLSSHDERRYVAEGLAIGVTAYVHKDDAFERLIEAMQAALRGEVWLSPRLAAFANDPVEPTPFQRLSPREREVLQLLAAGHNTKEAADKLGVSAKAIEYHRLNLFTKLEVKGLADLVRIAVKEGLIEP